MAAIVAIQNIMARVVVRSRVTVAASAAVVAVVVVVVTIVVVAECEGSRTIPKPK